MGRDAGGFKGGAKVSEQGFRAGESPPYGLHRLLLNDQRNPVQSLAPGQHKSIQPRSPNQPPSALFARVDSVSGH